MRVPSVRRTALPLLVGAVLAGSSLLAPVAPAQAAVPRAAAAAAAAPTYGPLDIVVLGDSYSAGNGATDDAGQPVTYGPEDCYRSRVGWAEKYAAVVRRLGRTVNLANHACSGGKAPDILSPRVMDTASRTTPTPTGVTTTAQADTYLAQQDPCNTKAFPDEEFWTYKATSVDASTIAYDCTRNLRPQAQFVTAETDLVVFTMGGNDAGFTTIVTQCFILKSGSGCQTAIDAARAKLPAIKQLLLDAIAGVRARGLREDAKIVQLGYPYLQTDNNYLTVGVPPYAAGAAVRTLIDDGTTALASVATDANVGHPGQMTFATGVKEAFAGHEPDATTPVGNTTRWVNQVGDGTNTSLWYHPNGLGQTAYATVLARGGDYGATPVVAGPVPVPPAPAAVRTTFRAKLFKRSLTPRGTARVITMVRRSDGSRPTGTLLVRERGKKVAATTRVAASGRTVLRVRGLTRGKHRLEVVLVQGAKRRVVVLDVVVRRRP